MVIVGLIYLMSCILNDKYFSQIKNLLPCFISSFLNKKNFRYDFGVESLSNYFCFSYFPRLPCHNFFVHIVIRKMELLSSSIVPFLRCSALFALLLLYWSNFGQNRFWPRHTSLVVFLLRSLVTSLPISVFNSSTFLLLVFEFLACSFFVLY